jgi:hypothetical protein
MKVYPLYHVTTPEDEMSGEVQERWLAALGTAIKNLGRAALGIAVEHLY